MGRPGSLPASTNLELIFKVPISQKDLLKKFCFKWRYRKINVENGTLSPGWYFFPGPTERSLCYHVRARDPWAEQKNDSQRVKWLLLVLKWVAVCCNRTNFPEWLWPHRNLCFLGTEGDHEGVHKGLPFWGDFSVMQETPCDSPILFCDHFPTEAFCCSYNTLVLEAA